MQPYQTDTVESNGTYDTLVPYHTYLPRIKIFLYGNMSTGTL